MKADIDPVMGGYELPLKFAKIDGGSADIVAAVSGKKIRVMSVVLVMDGAGTATWRSGGTTALSGAMSFAANGGYSVSSPFGIMQTAKGEKLDIVLTANARGHITYVEVPA